MRDKSTMAIALEAGETGQLVFCARHTIGASKTVGHAVQVFPRAERHVTRNRLAKSFHCMIAQRRFRAKDGKAGVGSST